MKIERQAENKSLLCIGKAIRDYVTKDKQIGRKSQVESKKDKKRKRSKAKSQKKWDCRRLFRCDRPAKNIFQFNLKTGEQLGGERVQNPAPRGRG